MPIRISVPEIGFAEKIVRHVDAITTGLKEVFKPGRITVQYPRERRHLPDNFRGLITYDIKKCISCFQCVYICPANAIVMKKGPDGKFYPCINYAKCIFCHFCVDTCTKGALSSTKISDAAFSDLKNMLITTEKLLDEPAVIQEEKFEVGYDIRGGELILIKKRVRW
jgi:NADH-quinone oxidoreductase subunit I